MALPRGIRNHNPFNLRHGPSRWQGLSPVQGDQEFCQFITPEWGIRAGVVLLRNYQVKSGLWTVEKMLNRFAPPVGDRNGKAPGGEYTQSTSSYIKAVAKAMGVHPKERVDVSRLETAYLMACAMIRHENGQQPYPREVVMQGLNLAGIK